MTYDEHADCDRQLNEAEDKIVQLQTEKKELYENLIEYGRHGEGCAGQWGKKYPCKCGWRNVEQTLKG